MEASHFIWAGWVLIFVIPPLLLESISVLLKFWSRGSLDKSWGLSYQVFLYKYSPVPDWYKPEDSDDTGDFWACYVVLNLLLSGVLTALVGKIVTEVPFQTVLNSGIIVGIILTVIFLPRFILDLCKGLKMNHKTGDLEEINNLKKRIEELESKGDK